MKQERIYILLIFLALLFGFTAIFYCTRQLEVTLPQDVSDCKMKYSDHSRGDHFEVKLAANEYEKLIASCGKVTSLSCKSKWQYLAVIDIQTHNKEKHQMVFLDVMNDNSKILLIVDGKYCQADLSMLEARRILLSMHPE